VTPADLFAVGVVLFAGGVWLDVLNLPMATVPVFGSHAWAAGLGLALVGAWKVVREVRAGGDR